MMSQCMVVAQCMYVEKRNNVKECFNKIYLMKALKSSNARDQNAQEGYGVISGPRQQESVFCIYGESNGMAAWEAYTGDN